MKKFPHLGNSGVGEPAVRSCDSYERADGRERANLPRGQLISAKRKESYRSVLMVMPPAPWGKVVAASQPWLTASLYPRNPSCQGSRSGEPSKFLAKKVLRRQRQDGSDHQLSCSAWPLTARGLWLSWPERVCLGA